MSHLINTHKQQQQPGRATFCLNIKIIVNSFDYRPHVGLFYIISYIFPYCRQF